MAGTASGAKGTGKGKGFELDGSGDAIMRGQNRPVGGEEESDDAASLGGSVSSLASTATGGTRALTNAPPPPASKRRGGGSADVGVPDLGRILEKLQQTMAEGFASQGMAVGELRETVGRNEEKLGAIEERVRTLETGSGGNMQGTSGTLRVCIARGPPGTPSGKAAAPAVRNAIAPLLNRLQFRQQDMVLIGPAFGFSWDLNLHPDASKRGLMAEQLLAGLQKEDGTFETIKIPIQYGTTDPPAGAPAPAMAVDIEGDLLIRRSRSKEEQCYGSASWHVRQLFTKIGEANKWRLSNGSRITYDGKVFAHITVEQIKVTGSALPPTSVPRLFLYEPTTRGCPEYLKLAQLLAAGFKDRIDTVSINDKGWEAA
jgi:hypothetical protein